MSNATPEQLWETAVHEAGHAVFAVLEGVQAGAACIVNADGSGQAGTRAISGPLPDSQAETPEHLEYLYRGIPLERVSIHAMRFAAGHVAADLVLHPERIETVLGGTDLEHVCASARASFPEGHNWAVRDAWQALAVARVRVFLKPHLARVRLVAGELHRKGQLTADEVLAAGWPEGTTEKREVTQCPHTNNDVAMDADFASGR